jgi:hypothetical protein
VKGVSPLPTESEAWDTVSIKLRERSKPKPRNDVPSIPFDEYLRRIRAKREQQPN